MYINIMLHVSCRYVCKLVRTYVLDTACLQQSQNAGVVFKVGGFGDLGLKELC